MDNRSEINSTNWWDAAANKWIERGLDRDRPLEYQTAIDHIVRGPILEVGFGFGTLCKYLRRGINYMGFDVSAKMVEVAREKWPYRIFVQQDILDLDVQQYSKVFEHSICMQTLEHFEDLEFRTVMGILKLVTKRSLIFSVPKGIPGEREFCADGHVIGWENEHDLSEAFSKWGKVVIMKGEANHICGELIYE